MFPGGACVERQLLRVRRRACAGGLQDTLSDGSARARGGTWSCSVANWDRSAFSSSASSAAASPVAAAPAELAMEARAVAAPEHGRGDWWPAAQRKQPAAAAAERSTNAFAGDSRLRCCAATRAE